MRLRILGFLLVSLLVSTGSAHRQDSSVQVWEKTIAPGLTYREEFDPSVPRMVHILRYNPGAATHITCELGSGAVYKADSVKGRGTVTQMVRRTGAIAGINGDFFPFTGDPLGLMVHEGRLISLPYPVKGDPSRMRAAFAWSDKAGIFSKEFRFKGTCSIGTSHEISLDGLNQECSTNQICLNTPTANLAVAGAPNIHLVIKMTNIDESVGGTSMGEVRGVLRDQTNVPIPVGSVVLTATGNRVKELEGLEAGAPVTIRFHVDGFNDSSMQEAIGGGPMLVRHGREALDASEEGFDASFSGKLHPRTAIGRRADGELWFVVVDGRQKMSEGLPLDALAKWFIRHGCVDAMNLDGGGSTAMNLFGNLVNRPSEGAERPVANGVLFYAPTPPVSSAKLAIHLPSGIKPGASGPLKVVVGGGEVVPNAEVIWSCTSPAAWVDQGGTLHAVAAGSVTVFAYCRGATIASSMKVSKG